MNAQFKGPMAGKGGIKKGGQEEEEEEVKREGVIWSFRVREYLWNGVYLFISQGLQLFRLALPVVFHDHHGGVDFAHRQVCGCWENDKLPCKIRPERDGTLSRGGDGSGGQDTQKKTLTQRDSQ